MGFSFLGNPTASMHTVNTFSRMRALKGYFVPDGHLFVPLELYYPPGFFWACAVGQAKICQRPSILCLLAPAYQPDLAGFV